MTQKTYHLSGLTCGGCVAKATELLKGVEGVQQVAIQLGKPTSTALIDFKEAAVPLEKLAGVLGKYVILPIEKNEEQIQQDPLIEKKSFFALYKPLLLIIGLLIAVTICAQFPWTDFSLMTWMRHFMAGFFIVFAFFKLLNIKGFAESYSMYDVVASRWNTWGIIYPFLELILGFLFLTDMFPLWTNIVTAILMTVSAIGVIQSNLQKRKIKCACLGDVFNLPMSVVTIIEDVTMIIMALAMIFYLTINH